MNDLTPSPSRLLTASAFVARWLLWFLVTAWLIFGLAWGALHGWIVPRIGEFRPRIEQELGKALGVPVRIGAIEARSTGIIPSFELRDVSFLDPAGREALRLPRVLAALSPQSLLRLSFEQLYIDAPVLDVRRTGSGKILIAGLDFSNADTSDTRGADWFFAQPEFVIHQGTLRWTDEQRAADPLELDKVDLVVRNTRIRHAIRLDATPPESWGDRFTLQGVFRQPLLSRGTGRWREWDGQIHADFSRVDVSQLRQHADIGAEIGKGNGALRAWADVHNGEVVGGTADVALTEVDVQLDPKLDSLDLTEVGGRLVGRRLVNGFEVSTQGLQFTTRDGVSWPGGNVFVSYAGEDQKVPAQGLLKADRLDLASIALIANRLPLGDAVHKALVAYAPKGLVDNIQASWQGPIEAPIRYEAKGRASGLALAAQQAIPPAHASPGISGANIDFEVTQLGGKAQIAIKNGSLDLPGVFDEPLVPVEELTTDMQWQIDNNVKNAALGPAITLRIGDSKFRNDDAEGEFKAQWKTSDPAVSGSGSRYPGILDLQGTLSRADGARVYRYLPLAIHDNVRSYVKDAVTEGAARDVRFKVKGDLHDIPFKESKAGEFLIAARVSGVSYAYVPRSIVKDPKQPDWPALTQLAGELTFNRSSMTVKDATARLKGAPDIPFNIQAQIPDLGHTQVNISADGRGPLTQALNIVGTSPLNNMTGKALATATANANADYKFKLALPISQIAKSTVQGSITLGGNDVQFTPSVPMLSRSRGVVNFSETGFTLAGVQARFLGGDLKLEGGSKPEALRTGDAADISVALKAQGNFTAEALRQAPELGFISRLSQKMTGGSTYSASMNIRKGEPEISLTSTLAGLGLNLPSPLNKPADAQLPLKFENTLINGPAMQDQFVLELGKLVNINYVRDLSTDQPKAIRGSIAVGLQGGESAPTPDSGVIANISLASVDLDAWEDALSNASGAPVTAAAPTTASSAASSSNAAMVASYLPTVLAVRAQSLTAQGRQLHNVVVGGSRDGATWRANVDADELNGYAEYRQGTGNSPGRVYARLARLQITSSAATEVETLLEQPDAVPALDVVVDDLELKGKRLGRVEIDAVNRGGGLLARDNAPREWRLNKLNVTVPEATFTATGNWAAIGSTSAVPTAASASTSASTPERRRTVMNFRMDIADSGALLSRFGMPGVIRRGKGRMEGQVAWIGSPLSLDYPTLSGQLGLNIESGQFLKADPGLAKLLGVLSLQSLPRRLTLDFRDVFSEGFAFDLIRGDARIDQGVASTNNLQMKGVNAAVLMEGIADIAKETQNLRVIVVPEINAGTASLVAAAINPAIGLGTFLAQVFLRKPLIEAATQEFHVDGTWTDPRMVKVAGRDRSLINANPSPESASDPTAQPETETR